MREPEAIDKLVRLFTRLPGIGPRQAKRFVYYLLTKNQAEGKAMATAISALSGAVRECQSCHRFFDGNGQNHLECDLCRDPGRDKTLLMVVEKDADISAIEHAGAYQGRYFVLGGLLPVLEKEPTEMIRSKELATLVKKKAKNLIEIIIALGANSEGDNTIDYLKPLLAESLKDTQIKISILGRGLSTGSELEYADTDTLKNALKNRA